MVSISSWTAAIPTPAATDPANSNTPAATTSLTIKRAGHIADVTNAGDQAASDGSTLIDEILDPLQHRGQTSVKKAAAVVETTWLQVETTQSMAATNDRLVNFANERAAARELAEQQAELKKDNLVKNIAQEARARENRNAERRARNRRRS